MWSLVRIWLWLSFWIFISPFILIARKLLKRPRLDNCLTWAGRQFDEKGGYFVIRWSRNHRHTWLRWPHTMWLPADKCQNVEHYIPTNQNFDKKLIPDFFFDGVVTKGDCPEIKEN